MSAGDIPRAEHPDPQRMRDDWLNLNGPWDFAIDAGRNGLEAGWQNQAKWPGQTSILVPFCPESALSRIGVRDFLPAVWYRRTFEAPAAWAGRRVLLHFGAVDFDCRVWLNGRYLGRHIGGYTPFRFDVTDMLRPGGENQIIVYVEDDVRTGRQPGGKQSNRLESYGCHYTRVTGIWQTVWLEATGRAFVQDLQILPSADFSQVTVLAAIDGPTEGLSLQAEALLDGRSVARSQCPAGSIAAAHLDLAEVALWEPGHGRLYDLVLELRDAAGNVVDRLRSYFGLRRIEIDGRKILLNGKPIFLRWVLDQGYWPDGIYTASSEQDLKADIERALACGFNGARLHQKVFEPRQLYWADRLGFLLAGEMGDWKMDLAEPLAHEAFLADWTAAVLRDRNRPSLILWTPLNESAGRRRRLADPSVHDILLRNLYDLTKRLDPTRPVIDTSGYVHVVTDIYDVHSYEQDPAKFAALFEPLRTGRRRDAFRNFPDEDIAYDGGRPYFVSEYGGIWWDPAASGGERGWGYGNRPGSEAEFLGRLEALTKALLDNPGICGFCYTQLYDIEQEVNGLYTYDRRAKFDPAVIRRALSAPAAMEKNP